MATKSYIIALEEHYYDSEVKRYAAGLDAIAAPAIVQRLDDLGELRLKEMEEAGIDLQVLSHTMPGLQKLDAKTAVPLARRANDRLNEAAPARPDRFAAFAALPTADPKTAADELERTVGGLGFKGAMVNGLTNGVFLEMGIDRILFSVDYPFVDNPPVTRSTETLALCAEDKEKLLSGHAKRLLKL
jgi:predicted TIM-barrel fold metal-dependent hydrolase